MPRIEPNRPSGVSCYRIEKEKQEIERLRNMTEEERRQELRNNPKQVTNKNVKGKYKFLQKYYHRGAFYLDEEDDVYKQDFSAPTLEDHFDKTILPKVMQVKNFGRCGRTRAKQLKSRFKCFPDMDEYYSSSVESSHEEEKVYLQAGSKFRKHLDLDQHLIVSGTMLVELPAKQPVVTILEDFVRYYTIRQLFECGHQEQTKSRRRNSSAVRTEHKVRDYEQIRTNVELCKEVADGLRVYFDFTLQDYLLYPQEKPQAQIVLAEDNLRSFTYIASRNLSVDMLAVKLDSPTADVHQPLSEHSDQQSSSATSAEERRRRRLRSHKNEENEFVLDFGALQQSTAQQQQQQGQHIQPSLAVEYGGDLSPFGSSLNILRSIIPQNVTISREAKEVLDDVFRWRILPSNAPAEPSMIYGAVHLARLIVKLPEFLSATAMADDKLKLLLKFLDIFAEFIEEHEEWFGKQFYFSLII